jgi:outer membrane immunogenic protein
MKMTLKAALLATVFGGFASTAFAADLMQEPPMAPAVAAPDSHFYVGLNVGYGWGLADHQPANPPPAPYQNGYDMNLTGFVVGGQVGAMFHLDNNMVLGLQGDLDWSNIAGNIADTASNPDVFRSQTIDWIATAEGRLGFDAGGFIPYVAGGVAFAQGTRTSGTGGGLVSDTERQAGLSVGAGVMIPVSDNMNFDIEARYQAFQPVTYHTGGFDPSVALSVTTIRAGLNFSF